MLIESPVAPPLDSRRPGRDARVSLIAFLIAASRVLLAAYGANFVTHYWDEWPLTREATEQPFGQFVLSQENGYWAPLSRSIAWMLARVFPYETRPATMLALALLAILFFLMWRTLRTFRLSGLASLALFAWFCWSPLVSLLAIWWSVAIGLLPAAILSLIAFRIVDHPDLNVPRAWVAGVTLAAAALFSPAYVPAVAFLAGWAWWRRRHPPSVLLGILVPSGLWLMAYIIQSNRSVAFEPFVSAPSVFSESWAGVFMLSLFGGPWTWQAGMMPWFGDTSSPLVFLLTATAVVLVGLLWLWRPPARSILKPWILGVTVNYLLLLWTSVTAFGPDLVRQGRYWAIMLVPTTLTAAALKRDAGPWSRRASRMATVVTALAVAGSCIATYGLVRQLSQESGRGWLDRARSGLVAHPDVVVADSWVPSSLMNPYLWPTDALASQVLRQWLVGQQFDAATSDTLWIFTNEGDLVPGAFEVEASRSPSCVPVDPVETELLLPPEADSSTVLSLKMQMATPGRVTIRNGSSTWSFQAGDGSWYVPGIDPASVTSVEATSKGCITHLALGRLSPT